MGRHLRERLPDGGQAEAGPGRRRDVVEADHRRVIRDVQPMIVPRRIERGEPVRHRRL
jgi:hypothetical protein